MVLPKIFGRGILGSVGVAAAVAKNKLQIINDQEQFLQGLDDQLTNWGLQDISMAYEIVAVVGSQSSGKSTLLNHLFGTDFAVMDPASRGRTTNGIWLSAAHDPPNLIVMDVEGSDGSSRDDNQTFERKSALFALATSRALVVNMWENQVGLYNGGNMGLLRIILEEYLALFGGVAAADYEPPQILFVIQAHSGITPLNSLSNTIMADLERMWQGIVKPPSLSSQQLKDHFNFQFESLPHIIWAPDAYKKGIDTLRKRFTDKNSSSYLFQQSKPPSVPVGGLELHMQMIWQKVQSSENLNLPSQHDLLAGAICDRISESILARFRPHLDPHIATINEGQVIDNLGALLRSWRSDVLGQYDRDTSHYAAAIHQGRRKALSGAFFNEVSVIVFGQLRNLRSSSLTAFDNTLRDSMTQDDVLYQATVSQERTRHENEYASEVHSLRLDGSNWPLEPESQQFMDGLAERATIREREKKLFNAPIRVTKEDNVGSRKTMTTSATLYRDGKLVVDVYTRTRKNNEGLRGRVLVVVVDVNGNAVGISNELRCTTRGGVWDPFTPSSGHDQFHLQLPADVGRAAFSLDIYQTDNVTLGGTVDRVIKNVNGVVAVATALGF
ncbi:hypothetical protein CVT24_009312 [Panaeolus cyanescens]|uniref:GB1/RHD3-type G domain-containing protein n=1 Tax=Panaeolus cyanescens TaxID=181874 RepID=A0A409Y8C8_9AGAR|nr:hypothetical protein CVT24_009312 [Panaeolus cyanescens]